MNYKSFSTSNLILKKIDQNTLDFVYANLSNKELMQFLGLKKIEELKQEKAKFEKGLSTFNKTFLYFQIIDKLKQTIIGWCGYHTWYTDHERAEIGYGLYNDAYKNKGIMTEAMEFIIPYGFDIMKLNRIEAFVGLHNSASIKILKKFNFQKEGLLREHYKNKKVPEDSLLFSLLKSDER